MRLRAPKINRPPRQPPQPMPAQSANPAAPPSAAERFLHGARFQSSAERASQLQDTPLPEIAFAGRSNSGKSSALNALVGQRQLAFASRQPGRTQLINLFCVSGKGGQLSLADLPGYGFARAPKAMQARWQSEMATYLLRRANLTALVLLCDSRRGLGALDEQLLTLLRARLQSGLQLLVLMTKSDQLTFAQRREALKTLQSALQAALADQAQAGEGIAVECLSFSARSGEGLNAAREWLYARRDATAPSPSPGPIANE